jgi:tRNA(Ile)-lysidine synthase
MGRQITLPRKISKFIQKHDLARKNQLLVVGVSGGPDSVCLLHILAGLLKTLSIKIHVAHLNHMLRGSESDADADYVSHLAKELGIPATIEKRDVKAYRKEHKLSLEEAAREVRYVFFSEVASSLGTGIVAVGHTEDDQIETILMHLVRGTGLAGLRGIQPLSTLRVADGAELKVVRPLLGVRREETEAYCATNRLFPRSDSSNQLPNYLRNNIRSQLIPLLREYNPDIDKALLRLASAADSDLTYIGEETSRLWGPVAREQSEGVAIDRAEFSRLHPALKRHLVRSALQRLLGELRDIESVHTEKLLEALAKPAGKRLSLPKGLAFYGDYGYGLITAKKSPHHSLPFLEGGHRLNIPGETEFCGWRVRSRILKRRPKKSDEEKMKACLDLDVVGRKLLVRSRQRGDRFQPLGMESPKKLQDFMVDAKIPRAWRSEVPLVCSPQHIIWVVGYRIDHRARVTPSTKRVLCLEFEWANLV